MLTPGEFVINKEATKNNLGLLQAINDGKTQGLNKGGMANGVQYLNRGAIVSQARNILDIITRGGGKMGTLDDAIKGADPQVAKILKRYGSINRSGGFATSRTQASSTIKRSAERTHFGNKQQVLSLEELSMILGTKGGSKRKIAEALVKGGVPVQSLTDDWILLPKSINQAARANSNTPMSISSVMKELRDKSGTIKFKDRNKDSAFSILNPNETSSSFVEKINRELSEYLSKNGDVLITDDIFTLIRNKAYPNMVGAGKATGIRLPSKTDIGTLAGVDINSPSFAKSVNDYFVKNNIPLSADQIVPRKPGSNTWWALQLLDSIGGNVTKVKNKFASSTGFNAGGPVPGTGNTDTVPAMLTPGEFVVNKKATSQNQKLLEMMNGGQVKGYAVGGLVAGAKALASSRAGKNVGSMVGGIAGFEAGSRLTGGNMLGGLLGGAVVSALPKLAAGLASAIGVSTASLIGITAPLALAGFAIYKLNKSLDEARKSGADLSEAMYGSSKTVKAMADAFGRETNATALRRKAIEKAGGQEITEEAVAASGEFMKTEAASEIIKDLELVKKSGEDIALALRNQLASSILSGAITPEEAKAIAMDMGKAIGDEKIAIKVAGQLSSLLGPNGEKITNNVIEITAEISPKINSQKIKNDAEEAYNSLNIAQKFGEIFTGGKESFVEQFSIDKISEENASALTKEAEARALLNLAYEEGTITLKKYLEQEEKITFGANIREEIVNNANAIAAGYKTYDEMIGKIQDTAKEIQNTEGYTTGGSGTLTPGEQAAIEVQGASPSERIMPGSEEYRKYLEPAKEAYKQELINSGFGPEAAQATVDSIENSLTQTDVRIFDKFISGQIPDNGYDILIRLQAAGNLTEEDIDRIAKELTAINTIPNIDKILNFNSSDEDKLTELYNDYLALEETPDMYKGISIKDQFSDELDTFKMKYEELMALPNEEKIVLLRNIQTYETITTAINLEGTRKGGYVDSGMREEGRIARNALSSAIKSATESVLPKDEPSGSGGGGGGGKSAIKTLKDYIKEFKLATKAKKDYFNATVGLLGAEDQEILALIDIEMYLKANITQRNILLALAKEQLNIQKAVAFLSLSSQEKELQGLDAISRALDIKSQKDVALLRARQRDLELNNRALDKLSEKEDAVNKNYDERIEALDKVAKTNDRIAQQDKSRIDLASALASGDIAAAASVANEMQLQSAQNQIEDTQAALEKKRQEDLKSLTIEVNGVLMTRADIEAANKLIQEQILVIEDDLYKLEDQRFKLAQEREKLEMSIYLLQLKQNIEALRAQGLSGDQLGNLQALIDMYNATATAAAAAGVTVTGGLAADTSLGAGGGAFTSPPPIVAEGSSTGTGTGAATGPAAPAAAAPTYDYYTKAQFNAGIKDSNVSYGKGSEQHYIARKMGYENPKAETVKADTMDNKYADFGKAKKQTITNLVKEARSSSAKAFSGYYAGGRVSKMAFGGVAYKGSTESPPALRMNYGSTVPGIGMTDKVPAILTPGEFVVRKSVAEKNRGFLNALNSQVFPGVGGKQAVPTNNFLDGIGSPRYSIPGSMTSDIPVNSTNVVSTSSPMYNSTYNVNVNVSGTNASPDEIANVVMSRISNQNRGNLRSNRY
jgi:hypothetical protein